MKLFAIFVIYFLLLCSLTASGQKPDRIKKSNSNTPHITVVGKDTFLLEEIDCYWLDSTGNETVISSRDIFEYYDNGLLKSEESQKYSSKEKSWIKYRRTEFYYQNNKLQKTYFGEYYGTYWQPEDSSIYQYYPDNEKLMLVTMYYGKNICQQIELHYNVLNLLEDSIVYSYNDAKERQFNEKIHYDYSQDSTIKDLLYYMSADSINWINRKNFYYDKQKNRIIDSTLIQEYNHIYPKYKKKYSYNGDNLILTVEETEFDTTNNIWLFAKKDSIYYDDQNNNHILHSFFKYKGEIRCEGYYYSHFLENGFREYSYSKYLSRITGKWVYEQKYIYRYSKSTVQSINIAQKDLSLLYNNTDNSITIGNYSSHNIFDINIYNIIGDRVLNLSYIIQTENNGKIYLQQKLPYGIYFIQLKNSKTVYQYKIYIY